MRRVLELELEQTNNDCTMFCRNHNNYNKHGPKIYGVAEIKRDKIKFPTKSPRLRPSSIPSGVLIHAAIWPQQI